MSEQVTSASHPTSTAQEAAELLVLGAIHQYPYLPVRPWFAIAEGQKYWELASAWLSKEDLDVAVQAAKRIKQPLITATPNRVE